MPGRERFQFAGLLARVEQRLPVVKRIVGVEQRLLQLFERSAQRLTDAQVAVDHDVEDEVGHADGRVRNPRHRAVDDAPGGGLEGHIIRCTHGDQQTIKQEECGRARFDLIVPGVRAQTLEYDEVVLGGAIVM